MASDSTCWRLLDRLDTARLGAVASARAGAREVVWAQRAELAGRPFPPAHAAGRELSGLVIDLDASVVVCHSEKEQAAPTFKKTFGFHPMLAFCDNTGEFLAATLRRGTRAATPPPTTSPSWTPRSRSCPTSTATAARSWSGPTPQAARGSSSPTSAAAVMRR